MSAIWLRPHPIDSTVISAVFVPIFLLWMIVYYGLGLYDLRQLENFVALVRNFIPAMAVNWTIGATFFYFTEPYLSLTPKTILLLTILFSHMGAFLWRRLWLTLLRSSMVVQKVAFLADEARTREFRIELARHPQMGYQPVTSYSQAHLVVVHTPWLERNWQEGMLHFNDSIRRGVPVVTLEEFYESLFGKILPENARQPSWLLSFALPQGIVGNNMGKRLFDLAVAAGLLLASAPLLILITAAIWLSNGRPIFYGQRRLGYLGKEFILWKFRSMINGADQAGWFTAMQAQDSRITALGSILRRLRLDELPQLWNVLRGEMSIVGPRPEWVKEVEVTEQKLPEYHLRHLVRPGITGWAQVHFRATDSFADSVEKLRFDLYYLKNYSLALDLSILLKTIKRVFISDRMISRTKQIDMGLAAPISRLKNFGPLVGRN